MSRSRAVHHTALKFGLLGAAIVALLWACLSHGSVEIPSREVVKALTGQATSQERWSLIVLEMRLPMSLAAIFCGASLAIAGLLLQTTFDNPLAGPSIMGVSTGASLGVAIVTLAFGGVVGGVGAYLSNILGACLGAVGVIMLLLMFSVIVKSTSMLLIVGIMIGYLTSSAIALLNFIAPEGSVHSFVVWGLGTFNGITLDRVAVMGALTIAGLVASLLMVKPLNALLLGSRYAQSLGVNIRGTRNALLLISGLLTAVATAFCGPIGFIGLIVPHVARMIFGTSNHAILIPGSILTGAAVALLCAALTVVPGATGVLPVNAITPIIGVPVIIYIILNRKKLAYFN